MRTILIILPVGNADYNKVLYLINEFKSKLDNETKVFVRESGKDNHTTDKNNLSFIKKILKGRDKDHKFIILSHDNEYEIETNKNNNSYWFNLAEVLLGFQAI